MIEILIKSGERIDSRFREYYWPLIVLLCIFAFVNFSRVDYVLSQSWNGWAIGDWLLNYEGGFIRRGLLGTFLISIGSGLGIPLNHLIYVVQCTVFLLFLLIFIYLIRNKKINFWYLILCFSPGFLLFNYYDGMSVGRKEILIYALFGFWCVMHERSGPRSISVVFFSLVIFLLTLTHEMVLFFMPYFILVGWMAQSANGHTHLWRVLAPTIASTIAVVLLLLFANPISEQTMCRIFITLGANENVCTGIISFGSDLSLKTIWQRLVDLELVRQFVGLVFFTIIIMPIYLAGIVTQSKQRLQKRYLLIFIYIVCFSVPLFLISIDWGRWIAIHLTLITIFLGFKLPDSEIRVGSWVNVLRSSKLRININSHNFKLIGLAFLYLSIFCLTYSFNHCCNNNWIEPFGATRKIFIRN